MTAIHIADTGLFVSMGQPSNRRYQAVRRFARRNDLTFRLPERVYEELTLNSAAEVELRLPSLVDKRIEDVTTQTVGYDTLSHFSVAPTA